MVEKQTIPVKASRASMTATAPSWVLPDTRYCGHFIQMNVQLRMNRTISANEPAIALCRIIFVER